MASMCTVDGCNKPHQAKGLCQKHYDLKRHEENPEKRREHSRKWRAENPEKARESTQKWEVKNQERLLAYGRKWRAKNPEKVKEKSRKWQAENPERAREHSRRWPIENPERARVNWTNRRAQKLGAFVEPVKRSVVWDRDLGICFLCKKSANPDRWDLAHVIPLDRGGEHSYKNTAVSHPRCNRYQSNCLVEELDLEFLK